MTAPDYCAVRDLTERLAAPLSAEDQTVQTMPDVSPTKWHRAHTTWFFETFVLDVHRPARSSIDERYGFLFNSYYEAVGPRHARPERGLVTRPGVEEIAAYRRQVDQEMASLLADPADQSDPALASVVELGLHHEQQHQELLIMDIKHVLAQNPCRPVYGSLPWDPPHLTSSPTWLHHDGGLVEVGHDGTGFAFDNEGPRHVVHLEPFALSEGLVLAGDWLAFMADGGYRRPELWMSDGWSAVQQLGWDAPEYWFHIDGQWHVHDLERVAPVDPSVPVRHVSWYEADAYARWAKARLPLEAEWEALAPLGPLASAVDVDGAGWFGQVWQWTASPYTAYPRFRPAAGAVGEYNGKFMVNQQVLRGSSLATPPGHARRSYRNFFPPAARWAFSGVRLARDVTSA